MPRANRCGDRRQDTLASLQRSHGLVLGPRLGPGGKLRPERCTPTGEGGQEGSGLRAWRCAPATASTWFIKERPSLNICHPTHEGLGNTVRRERSPDSERVEAERLRMHRVAAPTQAPPPVLSRGWEGGKTASVAKDTLSPSPGLHGAGNSGLRTSPHWTGPAGKEKGCSGAVAWGGGCRGVWGWRGQGIPKA